MPGTDQVAPDLLAAHLRTWLGSWPASDPLSVVGAAVRDRPGWDGRRHPIIGVGPADAMVVSVPPTVAEAIGPGPYDWDDLAARLPALVGNPTGHLGIGIFRWSDSPTALADRGVWLSADDPRVPAWLLPFGHDVLVALDGDEYCAGVGLKRHDEFGWEIAVGTAEPYRGQGLARHLVAQATRYVLDHGAIATYCHARENRASAAVAVAAGFSDRAWRYVGDLS